MGHIVAIHNLSPTKLRFAEKIGGLACPSIAYVKSDIPMQEFGEVTLIAGKSMANPSKNQLDVFDADTYTSRFPTLYFKVDIDCLKKMICPAQKIHEALGNHGDLAYALSNLIERNGFDRIESPREDTLEVALWYLSDQNLITLNPEDLPKKKVKLSDVIDQNPDIQTWLRDAQPISADPAVVPKELVDLIRVSLHDHCDSFATMSAIGGRSYDDEYKSWKDVYWHRYLDNDDQLSYRGCESLRRDQIQLSQNKPSIDTHELLDRARKLLGDPKEIDRYKNWIENTFGASIKRCYFIQRSASGKTVKKIDANLENISRHMKRTIRGGEDFNYGAGSIRAQVARDLSSWSAIKKFADSIVASEDTEAFKKYSKERIFGLTDSLAPHYKFGSDRLSSIELTEILTDYTRGDRGVLKEVFPNMGDDHIEDIKSLIGELKNAPTEYFEGKFKRGVTLDEFSAALVPLNLAESDPGLVTRLKGYGLEVQTYSNKAHYKVLMKSLGGEYGVSVDPQVQREISGPGL
jgi:hypothetical protein